MLRVHCMQLFYNLSDPAMEDALYRDRILGNALPAFTSAVFRMKPPSSTSGTSWSAMAWEKGSFRECLIICRLEGLMLREGSMVDATIIAAPSSARNTSGTRDPKIHQTRKGNQWYFGMKMPICVDGQGGLIHTMATTPAHVSDVVMAGELLHVQERRVHGDAGDLGINKRKEHRQGIA